MPLWAKGHGVANSRVGHFGFGQLLLLIKRACNVVVVVVVASRGPPDKFGTGTLRTPLHGDKGLLLLLLFYNSACKSVRL